MSRLIDLPPCYVGSYFGEVKSMIWIEVTDNYGPFSAEFRINRSVNNAQNVRFLNEMNQGALVWTKNYESSSSPDVIIDNVVIWHNPQTNSEAYCIQTEII